MGEMSVRHKNCGLTGIYRKRKYLHSLHELPIGRPLLLDDLHISKAWSQPRLEAHGGCLPHREILLFGPTL